jgi:transposase
MSELKGFVPIEDVARYFRVSISTIRMWARTNKDTCKYLY